MEEFKPGQVISPQADNASAPEEPAPAPTAAPEPERPSESPQPPSPTPAPDPGTATASMVPNNSWQFRNETAAVNEPIHDAYEQPTEAGAIDIEGLDWTAAEFIAHAKSPSWYGLLALSSSVVAILIYLLTKDKISTGIVILAAAALGYFAARQPHVQQYGIHPEGLLVGQKMYHFQDFKTFSVAEEAGIASIVFMPLKRFMPPLTIYVVPELEERVVNFLAAYLPFEQHKTDAVDSLLRRIRF